MMSQVDGYRQSMALVIGEIYSSLAALEETLEGPAPDVDIRQVEKIKAVAQFLNLGHIGGDASSFQADVTEVKARLKENEAAEYFRKMIQFSIVEIKCKLGNIQCELEENTSPDRAAYLVRAVDAIKEHLCDETPSHMHHQAHHHHQSPSSSPSPSVPHTTSSSPNSSPSSSFINLQRLSPGPTFAATPPVQELPVVSVPARRGDQHTHHQDEEGPPRPLAGADLRDLVDKLSDELARLAHALPTLESQGLMRAAFGVTELRRVWDSHSSSALNVQAAANMPSRSRPPPVVSNMPLEKQIQMRRVLTDSVSRLRTLLQSALSAAPAALPAMVARVRQMNDYIVREPLVIGGVRGASGGGGSSGSGGPRVSVEMLGIVHLQLVLQSEERAAKRVQADSRLIETLQHQLFQLNKQRLLITLGLRNLDVKISHMIRGRAGAPDDDTPSEPYLQLEQDAHSGLGSTERKDLYERMVSLLRTQPSYLANMCQYVTQPADADVYATAVAGSMFADSFLASEELLLLAALKECLTADLKAVDSDLFLRSNSISTKLIAMYCRRHAPRQYLVSTLTDPIIAIQILTKEGELNLEIDPAKRAVTSGLLAEDARWDPSFLKSHPELEAKVEQAQKKLFVFAKKFIEAIIASLPLVPLGLRFLCRLLVDMARKQMGEVSRQRQLTMLGGFFFLRFLVPAVITPEPYGIRLANSNAPLDNITRRNLLLIAKVLQNLANGCAFGDKEPFMLPLNAFLDEHRPPLEAFLESVAASQELPVLPSVRPNALERTVTMAPAELQLMHRLIYEHHTQLASGSPRDPIIPLAARLGQPPKETPKRRGILLNVSFTVPPRLTSPRSPARETLKAKLEKLLISLDPLDSDVLNSSAVTLPDALQLIGSLTSRPESVALVPLYEEVRSALDYLLSDSSNRGTHAAELTSAVLREMSAECKERRMRADQIDQERVELQTAVEAQEKEVTQLETQKRTLLTYLASVTQSGFLARTRSRSTKSSSAAMIGPMILPVKELERMGVLVPTEALTQLKASNVTAKLSCTNPGFVALETKMKSGAVRFFELQPARLLDELLTRDNVRFGDLVFDVRRLLAFLYKNFGC